MVSLKTIIVDDSALMRDAIRGILQSIPECSIVGEGTNGLEGLLLALATHPDLIVMDINMPTLDGLQVLGLLKSEWQGTNVVMVSSSLEPKVRSNALDLGATACLDKGGDLLGEIQAITSRIFENRQTNQTSN